MKPYDVIIDELASADRSLIIARLDAMLPRLWKADYLKMPGSSNNLLVVTQGDDSCAGHFCRYLFDHSTDPLLNEAHPTRASEAEDRVVAVWGTSRQVEASTRDKARTKGFPLGKKSEGYDRGHFFAHTMGGGLDINLFPQAARVNRGGLWRRMEAFCVQTPGTFSFVRPCYVDTTWRPARLEYGIVKLTQGKPAEFWGHLFDN